MQGGYYSQGPGMMGGGMNMGGMGGIGQMGHMGMGNPMMMNQGGMGMGMGNPMMNQGMGMGGIAGPPGMNMGGMPGMGMMQGGQMGMGNAWRNLDYNYSLPQLGYKPDASWSPWDLATTAYTGERLERGFFDNIISSLSNFFSNRHLSEEAARNSHRRVYFLGEGEDSGSKTLGGAAAFQAFLQWDRDHHSLYHSLATNENRERLVALAVAELFRLWDQVSPRSSRASIEEASQYAAATAQYLFDRHYDIQNKGYAGQGYGHGYGYGHGHGRSGKWSSHSRSADGDSDAESEGRRRRRSHYGQPYGHMGQQHSMGMGMPGYPMQGMQGMQGMQSVHGMGGMQGMPGMMGMAGGPGGVNMNPMMMNPAMLPQGMHGQMGEAQAVPGMHPYSYGPSGGVAMGNQPIDQMGNPTIPGGPGRGWYGYGQPRYY